MLRRVLVNALILWGLANLYHVIIGLIRMYLRSRTVPDLDGLLKHQVHLADSTV